MTFLQFAFVKHHVICIQRLAIVSKWQDALVSAEQSTSSCSIKIHKTLANVLSCASNRLVCSTYAKHQYSYKPYPIQCYQYFLNFGQFSVITIVTNFTLQF